MNSSAAAWREPGLWSPDERGNRGRETIAVIDTLIAAVRAGELDDLFSQAAKTGTLGKARKAA